MTVLFLSLDRRTMYAYNMIRKMQWMHFHITADMPGKGGTEYEDHGLQH